MDIFRFVSGPLLSGTLILFFVVVAYRLIHFAAAVVASSRQKVFCHETAFSLKIFLRALLPLHRLLINSPAYVVLRYILHIGLLFIPFFICAHNILFNTYLGFSLPYLPVKTGHMATFLLIVLIFCMGIRRILSPSASLKTDGGDILLLTIVLLPFLSGFMAYYHTTGYQFWVTLHVLSGEIMILTSTVLFLKTRISRQLCVGCAACTVQCPSGTLACDHISDDRFINYNHFQCIVCGTCTAVCPEGAASLRHRISIKSLWKTKQAIAKIELQPCRVCSTPFFPSPQQDKVKRDLQKNGFDTEYLSVCERCRPRQSALKSRLAG